MNEFLRLRKKVDEELIRNPLLLSLIIILFRNNLKLPESKLEIYQSCTKTLVDKWDLTKELKIELPEEISKRKETLFADLAFWQYERLSSENVKITNALATKKIANSIINKLKITDDWIHADSLAEGFMNYALKRSLYFDNNFTHKTFLEYFTAYWIFSNIEKKLRLDERNEIISKYIDVAFWSIVLELLINMIDQDRADTEIIDNLFNFQIEAKSTGLPFLLEITSFLKNISSVTISNLVDSTINYLISEHPSKHKKNYKEDRHFYSLALFINSNDFQLKIFKTIFYKYTKHQQKGKSLKLLILLYFELILNHRNFLLEFSADDFHNYHNIQKLINEDPQLYFFEFYVKRDPKSILFDRILYAQENFSDFELFKTLESPYDNYYLEGGYFGQFLYWQLNSDNIISFEKNMNILLSKGLKKILVIDHLRKGKVQFYPTLKTDEIIKILRHELADPILKLILLCFLWRLRHEKYLRGSKNIENKKLNSILKNIIEIKDYDRFFNAALDELNLLMFNTLK